VHYHFHLSVRLANDATTNVPAPSRLATPVPLVARLSGGAGEWIFVVVRCRVPPPGGGLLPRRSRVDPRTIVRRTCAFARVHTPPSVAITVRILFGTKLQIRDNASRSGAVRVFCFCFHLSTIFVYFVFCFLL